MCPLSRSPGWGLCRLSLCPRDQMELVFLCTPWFNPSLHSLLNRPVQELLPLGWGVGDERELMHLRLRDTAWECLAFYLPSVPGYFVLFSTHRHVPDRAPSTLEILIHLLSESWLSLFHRCRNWGLEKLSNLPKATQLASEETQLWIRTLAV